MRTLVVATSEALFQHQPTGAKNNHQNLRAEIWNQDHLKTKYHFYSLDRRVQWKIPPISQVLPGF